MPGRIGSWMSEQMKDLNLKPIHTWSIYYNGKSTPMIRNFGGKNSLNTEDWRNWDPKQRRNGKQERESGRDRRKEKYRRGVWDVYAACVVQKSEIVGTKRSCLTFFFVVHFGCWICIYSHVCECWYGYICVYLFILDIYFVYVFGYLLARLWLLLALHSKLAYKCIRWCHEMDIDIDVATLHTGTDACLYVLYMHDIVCHLFFFCFSCRWSCDVHAHH